MDRFKYVDPPEPKSTGTCCVVCEDEIFEGDEIVVFTDKDEVVHDDCYFGYIFTLDSENKIAGEE